MLATPKKFALNLLLNSIIQTYFNQSRCILHLSEENYDVSINNYPTMSFAINSANISSEMFQRILSYKPNDRCMGFLISTKNPTKVLTAFENYIRFYRQDRYNKRKYIFILPSVFIPDFKEFYFISDVLIVQPDNADNTSFRLRTHRYVGAQHNDSNGEKYKLLDVWSTENESFQRGDELFPDKIHNQFGRTINVACMDNLPFAHIKSKQGFELSFVYEFCRRYNATCNIIEETERWGYIYENFTGYGVQGKVVSDLVDIATGSLYILPYRLLFTDFSMATVDEEVTCIVPKPKELHGWLSFIKVFELDMWMLTGATYLFICVTKTFLTKFSQEYFAVSNFKNQIFFTLAAFVGQDPSDENLYRNFAYRFAHANIQIFSIMFSTTYTSILLRTMVIPSFYRDIRTVQDLAESGIYWSELDDNWRIKLINDSRHYYKMVHDAFRNSTFEGLREFSKGEEHGFGIERLPRSIGVGPFIKDDVIENYKLMTDYLYKSQSALQMRKHSVLIPAMNKLAQHAHEAGLFAHWELIATINHLNMKIQNALIYPYTEEQIVKLTVEHVKGPLAMLFIGLIIAGIGFVSEICVFMYRQRATKLFSTIGRNFY